MFSLFPLSWHVFLIALKQFDWLVRFSYIDLARAKSEALVNNTCKQKKIKSCNAKRGGQ